MKIYNTFEEIDFTALNHTHPAYLKCMMEGIEKYITNVHAEVKVLSLNGQLIPFSIYNGQEDSWIHSFKAQYIDEMVEEVNRMKINSIMKGLAFQILNFGKLIFRATGERTITVFPSFMSTTQYEPSQFIQIEQIKVALISMYPKHAIVFRTLNEKFDAPYIDQLKSLAFQPLISRAVYCYDPIEKHSKNERKDMKKDLKRYKKSEYTVDHQIAPNEFNRLLSLYEQVYLQKYSQHNPHYTKAFFEYIYHHLNLSWIVIRNKSGKMVAFMGIDIKNNVLFPAYFGLDTSLNDLYFITSGFLYELANQNKHEINNSAGAKDYKLARGSRPYFEYHYLYTRHLSFVSRWSYALLFKCFTPLGKRILKASQFQ